MSKLLMSMVEGTRYLRLCDNHSILGNPYKLRSFRSPTIRPGRSAIIMLMLILSGDVELNPGPKNDTVYPCRFCEIHVSWTHLAVCCNECSMWYHKSCISMCSEEYENVQNESWRYIKCHTSLNNTFHLYNVSTSNHFDTLSSVPGDDSVFDRSTISLSSPGIPLTQTQQPAIQSSQWRWNKVIIR